MEKNYLEFRNVHFIYHSLQGMTYALTDLSFRIKEGEFVAIVGPSGCGKSTLLSLIAGLFVPESGEISFPTVKEGEKPKIGYMLQHDHLFEWRSIYKNVILGLEINHLCDRPHLASVEYYLKEYGLWEFRDKKPSELSGGMRQRAALVRTLALSPKLLLLDEPFSALDYQTRLQVSSDICNIIKRQHKTAIIVTHDLSEAISLADRILVLSNRPARIKKEVEIHLTKETDTAIGARNAPEFKDYFNLLWKELSDEEPGRISQKA